MSWLRRRQAIALPLAVGLLLAVVAVALAQRWDDSLGDPVDDVELAMFPKGGWIRPLTLGRTELAADYVWLRVIQYYGAHRKTDGKYPYFRQLISTLLELDPHFINAYVFGALVITEDLADPQGAIQLLESGIEANPESWWLPFEIGVTHYIHRRDHAAAAPWLERASKMEGAPASTKRLAAYAAQKGGDRDVALYLWLEVYANAEQEQIRRVAYGYLQELNHPDFLAPNPHGDLVTPSKEEDDRL